MGHLMLLIPAPSKTIEMSLIIADKPFMRVSIHAYLHL